MCVCVCVCFAFPRRLLQQKVGEIGDTEHQLEMRLNQLSSSESRLKDLETELVRLREELADSRAEVTVLRASVSRLDHDKDLLNVSELLYLYLLMYSDTHSLHSFCTGQP